MHSKLLPVYILHFINFFNLMMWVPILEQVLVRLGIENTQTKLLLHGLIFSAYPVFQFLMIQTMNSLSDVYGRKRILLFSQFGTLLSIFITLVGVNVNSLIAIKFGPINLAVILLIIARSIDGVSGGNAMVTTNYANDTVSENNYSKTSAFSFIEYSIIAGSLAGVFFSPIISSTRFKTTGTMVFLLCLTLISIYVTYKKVHNLKVPIKSKINILVEMNIFKNIDYFNKDTIATKVVRYRFIFNLIFTCFITAIFPFLDIQFGVGGEGSELGLVILGVALITVFTQVVIVNPIVKKLGIFESLEFSKYLLLSCLIMFFVIPLIFPIYIQGWLLIVVFVGMSAGVNTGLLSFKPAMLSSVVPDKAGKILALEEQVLIVSSAIGFASTGVLNSFISGYNLPFATVFLILTIFIFIYLIFEKINDLYFS